MANQFFQFKEFRIDQNRSAMKVTTDSCIFGAWVVDRLKQDSCIPKKILDIGTGTGLLSLMIAQANPTCQFTAVEIDEHAAQQARENINLSSWKTSIQVLHTDIKTLITENKFDIVVSNPPFYENDLSSPDPLKNQAHHEHSLPFKDLITQLDRHLTPIGKFYILLPAKGIKERIELLRKWGFHIHHQTNLYHSKDHPVMRILLAGGRSSEEVLQQDDIFIQELDGEYTQQIKDLLSNYYLAF